MTDFIIPAALQIDMDDIGWWCGSDDRKIGGPSRTGMPRPHCVQDYQAVADLGKALNMKINCSLVLGEWDMDNRLGKEIPHFSHFGENWNNSAYRNPGDIREAVEIMNSSPYLDISLHGLYHGYYMDGTDNHDTSDFFYRINGELFMIPESEVRLRLDHFYRLYEEHGMTSPITCFITPSSAYRGFELSSILREYGIKYVATNFTVLNITTPHPENEPFEKVFVENDIITIAENSSVNWDIVDADFDSLGPVFGTITSHWPNYLNMDPEKHSETLCKQLPYFKKCSETYGIVMSRDIGFAATQELYKKHTEIVEQENTIILDLTKVPEASGRLNSFFISTKKKPARFENCKLGEIQIKAGFENYEIIAEGNVVKIHF